MLPTTYQGNGGSATMPKATDLNIEENGDEDTSAPF